MKIHHLLLLGFGMGCGSGSPPCEEAVQSVTCDDAGCSGSYCGPEVDIIRFFPPKGDDIAHQLSKTAATRVGDELKQRYETGRPVRVELHDIKVSTLGMGETGIRYNKAHGWYKGWVYYTLEFPFVPVEDPCDGRTSIDHRGGWGHTPDLAEAKEHLGRGLLPGDSLDVSELITTDDQAADNRGLREYWFTWRNNVTQKDCAPAHGP